jgi:polysaccharide pyruvyl transferase WcaK-like protein/nitrite reductase/ring-hydroxylating ferredoxin subunit
MHVHIGHTFFGAGNIGDDLVIGGFLRGIAASIPELKITCATPFDRDAQARRFPQIEWSSYDPASRRMLIAACDVWLGLGGTIFHKLDDSWLLVDQVLQLEDCRRYGKPAFFLCCSVDHRIDSHRPEIRAILDTASWIWTRDSLSTAALKMMGFDRVTTAADLAHLAMQTVSRVSVVPASTGFVCNFEQSDHYSIEFLVNLIAAEQAASRTVAWLVQEIRALPGSELDIYHRLPVQTQQLLQLCKPDYGSDSVSELLGGWQGCDQLFSTRFHAAIIGAWSGSRVVTFERQRKLRGLAEDLGMVSFSSMPDPDRLARAFDRARPVRQSALNEAVHRAEAACRSFLKAADAAIPTSLQSSERWRGETNMKDLPQPRLEHHSLNRVTQVGVDRLGPGLKRGEIFVVRGCLQAIGALGVLRSMIVNTLEEVCGHETRARAESDGLSRIHEFVPLEKLMQMNPLMKQRARLLAPGIVADLARLLPGLGADVHFEDMPNVRIFVPHDVSTRHETALKAYVERRGSGGELTLHPPHQDSRHFHPVGAINVWCAIDQVVEANGMSVFPTFYGHHLPFTDADGGIRPDQYLGPPVSMDLAPGDAWIFETIHLHGSTINQTDRTRFVISFRLTPDIPIYRDKPWYNYVRPVDCSPDGPPATTVDYGQTAPNRGPVTIDTSDSMPPPLPASRSSRGEIAVASKLVMEGEIRAVSHDLCIARINGMPVAFMRRCPHQGADLAGGTIRNSQIVCAWHGLRMNASNGRSGCHMLPALELVPTAERDGVVVISNLFETSAPLTGVGLAKHYRKEIEHFTRAADRFHAALRIYAEAGGQWGVATVCHARTAAVHALLGLPGSVIRDSLEAPATRLISAILGSDDRRVLRTAEEETTFRECWRRLGRSWDEEAAFSYGLALLALSRHGFELIGLEPLARDLGWTEPLWLRCLMEAMPASAQMNSSHPAADNLPRLMAQIRDRMTRLDPAIKDGILRAYDDTANFIGSDHFDTVSEADTASLRLQVQTLSDQLKEANADRELSHQQIQTLAGHLKEANTDREHSHRQIQTLSGHLREANADRELSHQNIHTLAKHLKEANADRELSHQHIQTLAGHLNQANTNLEAIQNGRMFVAIRKLSTVLAYVPAKWIRFIDKDMRQH